MANRIFPHIDDKKEVNEFFKETSKHDILVFGKDFTDSVVEKYAKKKSCY